MIMMASQITSLTVVYLTVYSAQIKENTKAPRHWPLCREFTGTGEFPAQRASYAENVSIWWRHHETDDKLLHEPRMTDKIHRNTYASPGLNELKTAVSNLSFENHTPCIF